MINMASQHGTDVWIWFGVLLLPLLTASVYSLLFDGPVVPCPKPAEHCLKDLFNRVLENQGCLGCQTGCQPGFRMTTNPRYYMDTDDPTGHYTYSGIPIANNINVSEPQWICLMGDRCRGGFFSSKMGDSETCSWCGRGCERCASFHNCERCFSGFSLNPHTLPGGQRVVTCSHSQVACPSAPDNCLHDSYVATGIGCAGCQSCAEGFVVTYNPAYMNLSSNNGTYDYMGLQILQGVDVNEPRYQCVSGDSCQDGWYGVTLSGTLICDECSEGCSHCSSRTQCAACKDGFTLIHDSATDTSSCSPLRS